MLTLVRRPQTFSVFGATGKNAAITFTSDRLSLSEAMAKAGGLLDERADPRAVFLFRYEPVDVVRALGQPIATGAQRRPLADRLPSRPEGGQILPSRPTLSRCTTRTSSLSRTPKFSRFINFFQVLSTLTGPITSTLSTCLYFNVC